MYGPRTIQKKKKLFFFFFQFSYPLLFLQCKHVLLVIATLMIMQKSMLINDPVHGQIEFNSLEEAIINTREFFRLKDISQLGIIVIIV